MGAENVVQKYSELCVFTNCQEELFEVLPFFHLFFFPTIWNFLKAQNGWANLTGVTSITSSFNTFLYVFNQH